MDKVNILGVNIDKTTHDGAVDKVMSMLNEPGNHAVFTPNSEIILMAYHDTEFCALLNSADLLTADGIGVVYASRILKNPVPERVAGFDVACGVIDRIAETGHRLYLFGGKPGVAEKAKENLTSKYPFLNVVGTHNGYFKPDEVDGIVENINASGADLLFVCLGAPAQEKWICANRDRLCCHVMMGIGGSLDVFAGTAERAPEFWCKWGLEWLYRLIKEPWRFKRMLALPKFGFTVLFKGKRYRKEQK
ncbi:MAG: WecB/TagA/CpsF family glycosyltransferase [Clostridiales bacterium]|nr:WecB/TagA/CpsF family glycosyltransferase [Clostridiales bacterium]